MVKIPADAVFDENVRYVRVTPELAREWIKGNCFNRNIRKAMIHEFKRCMKLGLWGKSDSMIVLATNGAVLNGQHRLLAVIASGVTIGAWVRFNAGCREHIYYDHGYRRSTLESLRLEMQNNAIRLKDIEVLQAVIAGFRCKSQRERSPLELIPYYQVYGKRIKLLIDRMGENFDTTVLAVLVKATTYFQISVVERFCELLTNPKIDHPTKLVVQYFLGWLAQHKNRRETTRREIYNWTQYILKTFVEGKTECAIPSVSVDLFLLETV